MRAAVSGFSTLCSVDVINIRLKYMNSMVIDVQQYQFNYEIMKDANAAMALLEKCPEQIQALNRIQTHNLCITGAMLYQLSY